VRPAALGCSQQPCEQRERQRGRHQQPYGSTAFQHEPRQVAADDFGQRSDGEQRRDLHQFGHPVPREFSCRPAGRPTPPRAADHTGAERAGTPAPRGIPGNLHDRLSSCYHVACFNIQSLSIRFREKSVRALRAGASTGIASTGKPARQARFSRFVAPPGQLPERRTPSAPASAARITRPILHERTVATAHRARVEAIPYGLLLPPVQ
jgi:hypothetical protein